MSSWLAKIAPHFHPFSELEATHLVIEFSVYAFVLPLLLHAWHMGKRSDVGRAPSLAFSHRWLSTLLWGMAFGTAVELFLVNQGAAYEYGKFALELGPDAGHVPGKDTGHVPLWVGIGWGQILYIASWTAQRLRHPVYLRPISAAFLAVNLDFALDPIAQHKHFWTWNCDPTKTITLYGVPFDNFLAWLLIVGIYTGMVRAVFQSRWLGRGSWGAAYWAPALAALGSCVLFVVARKNLSKLYDYVGQLSIFVVVLLAALWVFWAYAWRSRRDQPVSWTVLLLPIYFHSLLFVMALATGAYSAANGSMVVFFPMNMALGVMAFAWVSIDRISSMLDGQSPGDHVRRLGKFLLGAPRAVPRTLARISSATSGLLRAVSAPRRSERRP